MQEHGYLLEGAAFADRLASRLDGAKHRVVVVSAFMTAHAIRWLRQHIPVNVPVYLVVRWLPQDLLSGASDTESWRLANSYGWDFRAQRKLHAKVYLVDSSAALVGSANATTKGLALSQASNIEIGVETAPTPTDVASVESLVASAEPVSQALVDRIEVAVQQLARQSDPCELLDWPTEVWPQTATLAVPTSLCVSECFATDGSWLESGQAVGLESAIAHDLSLLGFSANYRGSVASSRTLMLDALRRTKGYGWLLQALQQEPQRTASFGRLTALLHDALIDDPRPYRSSVKQLLMNLLGWVSMLHDPRIELLRPKYTTVVVLRT